MTRFSKIIFFSTILFLFLWQVPWIYRFMTAKAQNKPFTMYSCVLDDFVMTDRDDKGALYFDRSGNHYTQKEYDALLPTFYLKQLVADGRFPDTIKGVEVDPREVSRENFIFRSSAMDVNRPIVGLYPLMESMSGRVNLEMPGDVFRINDRGIEFIEIETNRVDSKKSEMFGRMFHQKGFQFPAKHIAGNPTTKKEYDNGYLIVDHNGALFHLKMAVGQPYLRKIDLSDQIEVAHLFVTEYPNRKTLAFLTTTDHAFYALHNGSYTLHKIAVPSFDPTTDNMTIIGNRFDWTLALNEDYYAINSNDYSFISQTTHPIGEQGVWQKIGAFLFPISVSFTNSQDKYVKPRITIE